MIRSRIIPALFGLLPLGAFAQLSGTYTVGGTAPDFATITAAVNALNAQGASGNVTFNIRPGIYMGQYALGSIPGNPGTITFRNQTNGSEAVDLRYNATDGSDNHIFRVDGTDNLRFEHLTFRPQGTGYARAIHFFNAIDGFTVENCWFHGSMSTQGVLAHRALIHCDQNTVGTNDNPQNVRIESNSIFGGSQAIHLDFRGIGGARSNGLVIEGNEMNGQRNDGVRVNNAVGQITDNLITTHDASWYMAIATNYLDGGSRIQRNLIRARGVNGCEGIVVGNTQMTTGNFIADNMVHVFSSGTTRGITVYNLWGMTIAHNSAVVAGGDATNSGAFMHIGNFPDGQNSLLRNNLFANYAGGVAYAVNAAGNIATEDHNGFFSTGAVLAEEAGSAYATLAAYQAGTGRGSGNSDLDPVFPAQPDLHMNNCAMNGLGLYMPELPTDIDGEARQMTGCDMGADEFNYQTGNVGGPVIILEPSDLPYTLALNPISFGSFSWNTGASTSSITIDAGGNYSCWVEDIHGCTYTINFQVVVDITTTVANAMEPARLHAYPSPTTEWLRVDGLDAPAEYRLWDAHGALLRTGRYMPGGTISVHGLAPGLHMLEFLGLAERTIVRFVVE